jgi:hypothetical protein
MKRILKIAAHILLHAVVIAGFVAAVMLLWNWLMPAVFGLSAINFWQALGILALARILFGGMGYHHWMKKGMAHHHHNHSREKWQKMTPEERKEFVKNHHFGHCFQHNFCQTDKTETKD